MWAESMQGDASTHKSANTRQCVKTVRARTKSGGSPDGVTKSGMRRAEDEDFGEAIDQRLEDPRRSSI